MEAFADIEALESKYALNDAQKEVAEVYLMDATLTISELLRARGKSPEDIDPDILEMVTRDVAYRALSTVATGREVSQYTQSAIGYSETFTFSNSSGDVYLTRKEKRLLGLNGSKIYSILPHIGAGGGCNGR